MKKRVLVVEDEFSINDTLSYALKKEGYECFSAFSLEEGRRLFLEKRPSLVLLDVMLPDGNGFDLCKEICQECYVIMVTARDEVIDRILGVEIGADDYLVKPFEIREVIAHVKALFRREEKMRGTSLEEEKEVPLYEINLLARTVKKNGQLISLKRKEFDILALLYQHKGVVYSRDELLNEIWGYDYFGDTRTVDVHVRRLRASLGEDKENSIIDTVFGVGYVMRDENA